MKKVFLFLLLAVFFTSTYAQKGDLYVGAQGGYITNFKDLTYGLNISYHLADPLEVSFTGLMNPDIKGDENTPDETKIKLYSVNLDFRYYLLMQENWAMGPSIGGQYSYIDKDYIKYQTNSRYYLNVAGFNIGWHMRFNITENIKLNGGWRYTTANNDASHHMFYVGLGYTFNLF